MLYLLVMIASWVGVCVCVFEQNLPGTILFGAVSLVAAYLLRQQVAGGGHDHRHEHQHDHRHAHRHDHHHHGGPGGVFHLPSGAPSPYLSDGTRSPFASPEAIAAFHAEQARLATASEQCSLLGSRGDTPFEIPELPDQYVRVKRNIHIIEEPLFHFHPATAMPALPGAANGSLYRGNALGLEDGRTARSHPREENAMLEAEPKRPAPKRQIAGPQTASLFMLPPPRRSAKAG